MLRLILLLVTLPNVHSEIKLLNEDLSLASCLRKASLRYFQHNEPIHLLVSPAPGVVGSFTVNLLHSLLEQLYQTYKFTILTSDPNKTEIGKRWWRSMNAARQSDSYIMRLGSVEELVTGLDYLVRNRLLNSRARFMFVSTVTVEIFAVTIARDVINVLWDQDIINGVILHPLDQTGSVYQISTWYPFRYGKCGRNLTTLFSIGGCTGSIIKSSNWFPEKVPKNLNGCVYKVRTLVYPPFVMRPEAKVNGTKDQYVFKKGFEIMLLNTVADFINMTLNYSMSGKSDDYGNVNSSSRNRHNRSITELDVPKQNVSMGILEMLVAKQTDIGIGFMSLSLNKAVLDPSVTYTEDALTFCVPHSKVSPLWENLLQILSLWVWILLFATAILLITLILLIAKRNKNESPGYKDTLLVCMKFLQILTINVVTPQPRTMYVRFFYFYWAVISLYISSTYQTFLTTSLTQRSYEPQIDTMEKLLSSKLKILFTESSQSYFRTRQGEYHDTFLQSIKAHWEICENMEICLNRTAKKRDTAVAVSRLFHNYKEDSLLDKSGVSLVHCFERNILTFPIVMFMRRGFPVRARINEVIVRAFEGGLLGKWEADAFDSRVMDGDDDDDDDGRESLEFENLRIIFIVISIFHGLVIMVFIGEVLYDKYRRRQKHFVR